jgi:small subunit ribosomal protein S8
MSVTDPIADLLTRIRNACRSKHRRVDIPASKMKSAIVKILLDQKYIANYTVLTDGKQGVLRVNLKYKEGQPVIRGLRRVSKPGLRQYRKTDEMPRVLGGMGTVIVTTSKGIMTGSQAKKENVGGEVLAYIW